MGIADDIGKFSKDTFRKQWSEQNGRVVPDPEDLAMGNEAKKFTMVAILYADLAGSTNMVETKIWSFAAKIYKVFLNAAGRLIRHHSGSITAYDGDRVMGVFIGDMPRTNAVKCALRLKYCVQEIIQPALQVQYPSSNFSIEYTAGIDCSMIRAARTGVRGDNDLVWVGRAANYAAKLSSLDEPPYNTFITKDVYRKMHDSAKYANGTNMWMSHSWNGETVYKSC